MLFPVCLLLPPPQPPSCLSELCLDLHGGPQALMPPQTGKDHRAVAPMEGAGATAVAKLGLPPTLPNCSEQTPAWSCGQFLP